ncbi:MAG: zinc-ribbon domain-containing protein [Anaerolineales bacterium]|nr:zinc-ribbon domain-containing protein [Anaerolineales bacterium]
MTRKCPHCGEEIREEAIFCRFCRTDVEPPIWMSSLEKCPHCAEWVEQGLEDCPLCGKQREVGVIPRVPRPTRDRPKRPDELIADLRRETQAEEEYYDAPEIEFQAEFEPEIEPEPEPVRRPPPPSWSQPIEDASFEATAPDKGDDWSGLLGRRIKDESRELRPISELLPEETAREASAPRSNILPSLLRGLLAILLVGGIGVGILALVTGPGKEFISQMLTPEPTSTPVILPTRTPYFAPTLPPIVETEQTPSADETPVEQSCVLWDQVSLADADNEMCVYGVVRRWFSSGEIRFVAIFSEDTGTFAFVDYETTHPEVRPGTCIMSEGMIEIMRGTRPFIDISESWQFCPEELNTGS